jgi:hypothetical protein
LGWLHASHWPVQSLLQHTPSTQCPVEHSASIEHFVPPPASGLQTPPRQKFEAGQSLFVLQPVHCFVPQTPGAQSCVRGEGQAPDPSQCSTRVATPVFASQDAARHWALCPGNTHAVVTVPSHTPSQPLPLPTHAARGGTGLPFAGEHVPARPGRLHASHCPTQSSLQQTPSTQKLVAH